LIRTKSFLFHLELFYLLIETLYEPESQIFGIMIDTFVVRKKTTQQNVFPMVKYVEFFHAPIVFSIDLRLHCELGINDLLTSSIGKNFKKTI
jgi:hypothetical protein